MPILTLLRKLGLIRRKGVYRFDADLSDSVLKLSMLDHRSPDDVAGDLLALGLQQRQAEIEKLRAWHTLTPREKEVAALMCLGYTNPEIAERLTISPKTVKVHIRNILSKFELISRFALAQYLVQWDFSAWGPPSPNGYTDNSESE